MRILIDARLYGLEHAGIGRYVLNLVEGLKKVDKENEYVLLLRESYFNKLKFPKKWKKVLFDARHYGLAEQVKLPRVIAEEGADLVHFPHFNVPIRYRGKYVVTIHDLLMHRQKGLDATTLNPIVYGVKRMGYSRVFAHAVNDSKRVIVPTKWVKRDLLRNYEISEEKVVVVYEGVDKVGRAGTLSARGLRRKHELQKDYFIYVGNAYPHKNLARAIEAVVGVSKTRPVSLAIVTSRGVFEERLRKTVADLRAEDCVRLLGFIPDKELVALYRGAAGFVYPSMEEGFGLPGLEAMSAGTLVLASDIGVFKEVYEDKAIYFNPYDFSSIQRAMRNALTMGQDRRRRKIAEGKKFVQKYSWEKMVRETVGVYNVVGGLGAEETSR